MKLSVKKLSRKKRSWKKKISKIYLPVGLIISPPWHLIVLEETCKEKLPQHPPKFILEKAILLADITNKPIAKLPK